jgi:hypothetical protein
MHSVARERTGLFATGRAAVYISESMLFPTHGLSLSPARAAQDGQTLPSPPLMLDLDNRDRIIHSASAPEMYNVGAPASKRQKLSGFAQCGDKT